MPSVKNWRSDDPDARTQWRRNRATDRARSRRQRGFYLIDTAVNFDRGERGHAEALLDHSCSL